MDFICWNFDQPQAFTVDAREKSRLGPHYGVWQDLENEGFVFLSLFTHQFNLAYRLEWLGVSIGYRRYGDRLICASGRRERRVVWDIVLQLAPVSI